MGIFSRRTNGSKPEGWQWILYGPLPRPEQDSINHAWPQAVTQYGAKVQNVWMGNQLPGYTNFIPEVWQSYAPWSIQRNLQLTQNVQLSRGTNSANQTMDAYSSNMLAQQAGNFAGPGGLWQRGEL